MSHNCWDKLEDSELALCSLVPRRLCHAVSTESNIKVPPCSLTSPPWPLCSNTATSNLDLLLHPSSISASPVYIKTSISTMASISLKIVIFALFITLTSLVAAQAQIPLVCYDEGIMIIALPGT